MDTFARAFIVADRILKESNFLKLRKQRYASFDSGKGKEFEDGKLILEELRLIALAEGEPRATSGKQEMYEQLLNTYI
jgi:xylose isomerase